VTAPLTGFGTCAISLRRSWRKAVNKEELFVLADYISDTYSFVEIRFIEWVVAEQTYALVRLK
jgi:hypothetical protein